MKTYFSICNSIIALTFILLSATLQANTIELESSAVLTVTGTVTDEDAIPLIGVTVYIKETKVGTVTDLDGKYSIEASTGDVITFSYTGMKTENITVGSNTVINIEMVYAASQLDEIVLVGYRSVKKSDVTGSVAVVDVDKAYVAPVANLNNALQGRASGVQVTSANGAPGSSSSIRIRGGNSISAGNSPLYVIDGFVGAGSLSTLNPNDIESIQVLKDASSTAIYGARGSNGVVLITTKKGALGKPIVNFKTSIGVQSLPSKIDVQTGREFAEFINNADPDPSDGLPFDLANLPGEETDWQDVMIRNAPLRDFQLSVSGGSESTKYYISTGYLEQEGIVRGTGFDRMSLRTNINTNISKVFSTGLSMSLSRTNSDNNNISFQSLIREDPLKPVYDSEGNFNLENFGVSNTTGHLLANNTLNQNTTNRNRALLNTFIQASLADKVTVKSTFSGDFLWSKTDLFVPSTNPTSIITGRLGSAGITNFNDVNLLNENTINYGEKFGNHSINVLGGITFQTQNRETTILRANEIPSDGVGVNAIELAPVEETSINSNYSEFSLFSVFGRVDYSFNDKYLLTGTIRRDGSSRLGKNNRFAIFPSAGLTWKVSEEPFLRDVKSLDILKIKSSYGITGNQGISPFSTLSTFNTISNATIINGVPVAGVVQGSLASPDLKWETTKQFNIGVEASFFNGRITGEVEYYAKTTDDLLLAAEVPFFTGFTTTIQNVGSLQNNGVDVSLTGVIVSTNDVELSTSLSVSTYKNKVLDLGDKTFLETNRLGAPANDANSQLIVGEPVGVFWGAIFEGINPETGDATFRDISGPDGVPDGQYDPVYDKTVIGDANPDFYGGIQIDLRIKNIDFLAFLPFSVGNENYNEEAFLAGETQINSFSQLRDNIWSASNTENASFPAVGSTSFNTSNSFFVQDASYLRLGTLQLGYTLPKNTVRGISDLRVFATGTNLFLFKSQEYLGFDPDVSSYGDSDTLRGFDRLAYPNNRSLLFGLDIKF